MATDCCPKCGSPRSAEQARTGECESCMLQIALDTPGEESVERAAVDARDELKAQARVGPFEIVRTLGEGGMGIVYLAEQLEPVRRTVALKIIKRGMDSAHVVARFEAERQALALMDHPSIAQIFEAGEIPGGRPYFAMEYIEGQTITEYCDALHLGTRDRLELFLQVCDGIRHAHQKGIIHRDIKPSNVLVTRRDGESIAKIIDFGVAKALETRLTERTLFTELGVLIGTPEYMSPEQVELSPFDVDTRTDVYSLGVLLYELLTGALPFDSADFRSAGFSEICRKIRENRPARPSTRIGKLGQAALVSARLRNVDVSALRRQLSGDLDVITMKALEKERVQRYGSPGELAADIRRHLDDEPVLARPPSAAYLLRKMVLRHRLPAALAAALVLILIGFSIWISVQYRASQANLARALGAEAESAQVSDFLIGVFEVSDPGEARGNSVTARELLDKAAVEISTGLADQPGVQAKLMNVMGQVYMSLGLFDQAGELLESSLARRRELFDEGSTEIAEILLDVGRFYTQQGKYDESEEALKRAIEILETARGPEHVDVAAALHALGAVHWRRGEYEQALAVRTRSLEIREKEIGPESVEVAESLGGVAHIYLALDRFDEAESLFKRALETSERAQGTDHPDFTSLLNGLAEVYRQQARFDEAEPLYLRSLEIDLKILGPEHPTLGYTYNNLALFYKRLDRFEEAEPLYLRALEIREATLPPEHQLIAWTLDNLGMLYLDMERSDEAGVSFDRALAIAEQAVGPEHTDYGIVLNNIALLRKQQKRYAECESLIRRTIEIWERAVGPEHRLVALGLHNLASLYEKTGRDDESEPLYRRALAIREKSMGPDHPRTESTRVALDELLKRLEEI
jgi:non-specific serine/threonine protein kinase/serine/threonine-protein kinase